jgi:hypothetical protein
MNHRDIVKEYGFNEMTSFVPLLDDEELADFLGLDLHKRRGYQKTFSKSREIFKIIIQ